MNKKKTKILLAKPGLDGHDVGAKVVAQALIDAGFEVVYTGLKKTVDEILAKAKENSVDVLGLSILSGAHLPICENVRKLLPEYQLEKVLWTVGGNIPAQDHEALKKLGVHGIFPFGTPLQKIVDFINENVK